MKISDHKFNICMLITLHGEETKKRERILTREECRANSADAVNQTSASYWREEARTAASASPACGSIGDERLKGRRATGERTVGRGGGEGSLLGQDVTSVLEHVKISQSPQLPSNPSEAAEHLSRVGGRPGEGKGEGLHHVKDVVGFFFINCCFGFFCEKLREENRPQLWRAEPEGNH